MADTDRGAINQPLVPIFAGRTLEILTGIVALYFGFHVLAQTSVGYLPAALLVLVGISFVVDSPMANPGCASTALAKLALPEGKRRYRFRPVWSPVDRAEDSLRKKKSSR